jgi:hypothetical protein
MMNKMIMMAAAVCALVAGNVAMANDAEMKKLLVGTWTADCTLSTVVYKSDGTVVYNLDGRDVVEKWDVKDGALLETDYGTGRMDYFKILFLTKHEWLMLGMTPHSKGYFFYWRKDEDRWGLPPISKIDADWARANAARIEAEKKAKAAAGPTEEEKRQAAHDAEIRANNERALKGQ